MDPEATIIHQMGLMLTQLRFARRALEDIERSTARYGTFNFANAFERGAALGAPPLLNGALKVYVVNINELAPGQGLGGFIEGLLGGIGRFFGGVIGGITGGIASGVALPYLLAQLGRIASTIERIIERLGIRGESSPAAASTPTGGAAPSSSGNLTASLPQITAAVQALTGLFTAASSGPGEEGGGAAGTGSAPAAAPGGWLPTLNAVYDVLGAIGHIIDGLIIFMPILIGSFATFLVRLDDIKLAIIEMLQFALRNVLILREVTLITIFDTVSAAARLAANILGILATAIDSLLGSVFTVVERLFQAALAGLRFVSNGIRQTINALLPWLLETVGSTLIFLGDTRIFRVIFHLVRILPNILPPLVQLVRNRTLSTEEVGLLRSAADIQIPGPSRGTGSGSAPFPAFPDLAPVTGPGGDFAGVLGEISGAGSTLRTEARRAMGAMEGSLRTIGGSLSISDFTSDFSRARDTAVGRAGALTDALQQAQQAAQDRPQSGLETIAQAYEGWLASGGMGALLDRINEHFQRAPTLPRRVAEEVGAERTRATVEITEMVIEIEPPSLPEQDQQQRPQLLNLLYLLREEQHDFEQRGGLVGVG